jgi:hypothetical protein
MRRLSERDEELSNLRAALDAARAGHGAAVLVEGEAGIGKSALLAATAAAAGDLGVTVLAARGTPLEAGLAFGVIRNALLPPLLELTREERAELLSGPAAPARRILDPDAPGYAEAPEAPFDSVHAVAWAVVGLADRLGPLALLLDDLHWADPASLRVVAGLAERLAGLPVAAILAARPAPSFAAPELAAAVRRAGAVLRPSRLSPAGVAEVLGDRLGVPVPAGLAEQTATLTDGSPYLVTAVSAAVRRRGGAAGDVALVGAVELGDDLAARLAGLPPPVRRLVEAVAVAGDGRSADELIALSRLEGDFAEAVAAAVREGLLVASPEPGLRPRARPRRGPRRHGSRPAGRAATVRPPTTPWWWGRGARRRAPRTCAGHRRPRSRRPAAAGRPRSGLPRRHRAPGGPPAASARRTAVPRRAPRRPGGAGLRGGRAQRPRRTRPAGRRGCGRPAGRAAAPGGDGARPLPRPAGPDAEGVAGMRVAVREANAAGVAGSGAQRLAELELALAERSGRSTAAAGAERLLAVAARPSFARRRARPPDRGLPGAAGRHRGASARRRARSPRPRDRLRPGGRAAHDDGLRTRLRRRAPRGVRPGGAPARRARPRRPPDG